MEEKEVVQMEQKKGFCGKVCDVLTSDTAKTVYKYAAIASIVVVAGVGGLLFGQSRSKSGDTCGTEYTPPSTDDADFPLCSIE